MSDITTEKLAIAPGVLNTIISLAVKDVPGVALVGTQQGGLRSLFSSKQSNEGVTVTFDEDANEIAVMLSLSVYSGFSMSEIARTVRILVADAVLSQTGLNVSRVDICVESIVFQDK